METRGLISPRLMVTFHSRYPFRKSNNSTRFHSMSCWRPIQSLVNLAIQSISASTGNSSIERLATAIRVEQINIRHIDVCDCLFVCLFLANSKLSTSGALSLDSSSWKSTLGQGSISLVWRSNSSSSTLTRSGLRLGRGWICAIPFSKTPTGDSDFRTVSLPIPRAQKMAAYKYGWISFFTRLADQLTNEQTRNLTWAASSWWMITP